jgi:mRNA-degrading endonuclease RelE of RelBE toxin-antitoxin system/antitoxin (DNA-binding transcriptional repressor) of toxin-antitoxin stability system
MFTIEYAASVTEDLKGLRAVDRKTILDTIEEQLTQQPTQATRNKKIIAGLVPPWEHQEPIWELRVAEYRVFYDVNEEAARVIVRAIRHMKTIDISQATLDACVTDAQSQRVVVTRDGNPVALIVGIEGLDEEQIELAGSDTFWKLIADRRTQQTITREALERVIEGETPFGNSDPSDAQPEPKKPAN